MEPNYSEYSISELKESLQTIDKEAFPERTAKIINELSSRRSEQLPSSIAYNDNFEPNEQFYKCPHCEEQIGFFSKAANKWGKVKSCPHCGEPFTITVKFKVFVIAFIPLLIVHLFLIKPILLSFGLNKFIGVGIICGIITLLSMRYKRFRVGDGT